MHENVVMHCLIGLFSARFFFKAKLNRKLAMISSILLVEVWFACFFFNGSLTRMVLVLCSQSLKGL